MVLSALLDLEIYPIQAGNGGENLKLGLPRSVTELSQNREHERGIELQQEQKVNLNIFGVCTPAMHPRPASALLFRRRRG